MKNILTIASLGLFVSGFASNGIVKKNTINLVNKIEVVQEADLSLGLCKGSVVVIGSDGKQTPIEMTAVETADALECGKKFLAFVELQEASYTVVSSSSNYSEEAK